MIALAVDDEAAALIAVADPIKPDAAAAIARLRAAGLRPVMLTGDHKPVCGVGVMRISIGVMHENLKISARRVSRRSMQRLIWLVVPGIVLAVAPALQASEKQTVFASGDCLAGPHVTPAAEKKAGGRLFGQPLPKPEDAMTMSTAPKEEPGAHVIHQTRFGGVFMMAPNKVHHVEALYSRECGLAVILFNANTEPIHVERFAGFVNVKDRYGVVMSRFLRPNPDQHMLQTPMEQEELPESFDIDLYLLFPGEPHRPELFNYHVDVQGRLS